MSSYAGAIDVRLVDRITNAVRRALEGGPWYSAEEAVVRRNETERVRRRSIAARLQVEDIARRYQRADRAIRR